MELTVSYQFEPYASGSCRVMVTLELPRGSICSIQVGTDAWMVLWRAVEPLALLSAYVLRPLTYIEGDVFTGTQVPLP